MVRNNKYPILDKKNKKFHFVIYFYIFKYFMPYKDNDQIN